MKKSKPKILKIVQRAAMIKGFGKTSKGRGSTNRRDFASGKYTT